MAAAGWTPTVDSYLGQVTKARIGCAAREARGERAADRIAHLKKGDMAKAAEGLLAGMGWLPEPLRTPGQALPAPVESVPNAAEVDGVEAGHAAVPERADGGDPTGIGDDAVADREETAEPTGGEEDFADGESYLADDEVTDDQEVAFEPHAIAAE